MTTRSASRRRTWRLRSLGVGFALAAVIIAGRLVHLQLIQHDIYAAQAAAEHQGFRTVYSQRGAILDRDRHPLALSVDTYEIYIDRGIWKDRPVALDAADRLAPILGVTRDEILNAVGSGRDSTLLIRSLDLVRGKSVIEARIPGVQAVQGSRRIYPEGNLAAALIGFVGKDPRGLSGIEADYDAVLAGKPGEAIFDRDSMGNEIVIGRREVTAARPGSDLALTIDRDLQRWIEPALDKAIAAYKAKGGSIIIEDPKTGAILAMASRPSFDLLRPETANGDQLDLFRNRVVTDMYEPGSVFKLITMAAAIDKGLVNPNTTYVDSGVLNLYGQEIRNWDLMAYGTQTMTQVLQNSLNIGAAWIADKLNPSNFYAAVAAFGFSEPTGSGLAGEAAGTYRTPTDREWTVVDLATNSFGQAIAVTPLQMINAVCAIVNGGNLMRPYVVREIDGPTSRQITQPQVIRRVISEKSSRTMRKMMDDTVNGKPGHAAQLRDYTAGGKSGTANISSSSGYSSSTIASFVGIAPADEPRFVMLVKIDNPADGQSGAAVAAPIFAALAPRILAHLGVPPEAVLTTKTPGPPPTKVARP
ncbi:MAG: penicillin-binding protein 2 [Dehalococcoidia bacterium]|nr:penicillin-binding protein 2 [Dehalococcoidia bacterium]